MRMTTINKMLSNTTISASGFSSSIKKSWAEQLIVNIRVRNRSGVTPSMVVKVQSSPDDIDWSDLADSATFIAKGTGNLRETNFGKYIRLAWTLTGTTPVFTGVDMDIQCKG